MDELEEIQKQMEVLRTRVNELRTVENLKGINQYKYLIGKCYRRDNTYYRILDIRSVNIEVGTISIRANSIYRCTDDTSLYKDDSEVIWISMIESLLIDESEFLKVVNEVCEEIKKY